jgi:hypothetical protein
MSTIILLILVIIVLVVVGIFFFTQFAQGQTGTTSAQNVASSGIDKFLSTKAPDEMSAVSSCRTFCEDAIKATLNMEKSKFSGMQSGFCSGILVKDKGTKYCGTLFGGCELIFSDRSSCIASCSGNTLKCS